MQLPSIDNGAVVLSGQTVGSSATYTCSEGFVLDGDATRICQSNGMWSLTAPICRGITVCHMCIILLPSILAFHTSILLLYCQAISWKRIYTLYSYSDSDVIFLLTNTL